MTEKQFLEIIHTVMEFEKDSSRKAHAERTKWINDVLTRNHYDGLEADDFSHYIKRFADEIETTSFMYKDNEQPFK